MTTFRFTSLGARLLAGAAIVLALPPSAAAAKPTIIRGSPTPTITTYATGFNNPRGLKFGPDGMLYVAEGGVGGTGSTEGECTQVIPPIGPYTGSPTGSRISRVENGVRVTFNDKFASSQTSALTGNLVSGVADIAWVGGTMYAVTAGGGCSHGVLGHPNGVYRVNGNNTPTLVADLSAFYQSHPVANPEEDDFEPDGTAYSMIASGGSLYVVEPNHGELDRVSTSGSISRVADISATQGHIVPTAIAQRGGFYIGNLNTFPIVPGSSKILRVTLGGQVQTVATGLTTVVGVAFDSRARMYVLENTVTAGEPAGGEGEIVRFTGTRRETLVTGLTLPTAMTFGPDGALYVSNVGFGPPPIGLGEVLRIRIDD
jgi:hypothetical protein